MELQEAIHHAWNGRALLFVGAGFSRGATNLRGKQFKNGAQLAEHLANQSGLTPGVGLEDAAEEFISTKGPDALLAELQAEFTAKQVLPFQLRLVRVPWKKIYTTNYDDVIESSFASNGQSLTPVTLGDDITSAPQNSTLCVHLNGYVGRLTRETVSSEIKLTDTSYLTASVAESSWSILFRQDLESAQAVFFIGYSIWDLDIRRILHEHSDLKDKSFYVLGSSPEASIERRVARFGKVVKEDSDEFVSRLTAAEKSAQMEDKLLPISYAVHKFEPYSPPMKLEDRFIFELLLFGKIREGLVFNKVFGKIPYCILRNCVDTALGRIKNGARMVVFHSDLGNGKTMALELLKCCAAKLGYTVFSVAKQADSLYEELEHCLSFPGRKIIVIDNYPEWLDALKFIGTHPAESTSIVLSARTASNDVLLEKAAELLRTADITEIQIDRLGIEELNEIISYFNEYGLWGDQAAWSRTKKQNYLSNVCGAQWHAILIKRLESPQIQGRLEKLFAKLRTQKSYSEVIVAILVLAVIGFSPNPDMLLDLCGQVILDAGFKRDPVIREIIDFSTNQIILKSSVAGQFFLHRVVDPNVTIKAMIALAKNADKAARASRFYLEVQKSLMRHSNVQSLLPEKDRGRITLAYYESIKGLSHAKSAPLFWLQYAIASLVSEEFDRAEKYFQTAYSFANSREYWDTFQIDNHYARFLLMRAIHDGDASTCMAAFRSARKIIHNEIERERERLRYPYRVAALYADFYNRFAPLLKDNNQSEIQRAAQHVVTRIEKLSPEVQEQASVRDCWEKLQRIIEKSAKAGT